MDINKRLNQLLIIYLKGAVKKLLEIQGIAKNIEGFVIIGYPSFILDLAKYNSKTKQKLNIKAAMYSGDGLTKKEEELIKKSIPNIDLISCYGSNEGNVMAFAEAKDNNVFTILDDIFVWIRDEETGKPITKPGLKGQLIVTCLYEKYKPFNFATFDSVEWAYYNKSFRLIGRIKNFVQLHCNLDFEGKGLQKDIINLTGASKCQMHIIDTLTMKIIIDDGEILDKQTLYKTVVKQAVAAELEYVLKNIKITLEKGKIETLPTGKTPLVIDYRFR